MADLAFTRNVYADYQFWRRRVKYGHRHTKCVLDWYLRATTVIILMGQSEIQKKVTRQTRSFFILGYGCVVGEHRACEGKDGDSSIAQVCRLGQSYQLTIV